MGIAAFLSEVWALMGPNVRKWILSVLGVSLVLLILMAGWLFWSTGELHRQFGILPTTDDLRESTKEITDDMATKGDVQEVRAALYNYQDSLGRLRAHLDTGLITPGLGAIVDLQKRMGKLESTGVETRIAIEESKRQGEQNQEALIRQMNAQSSADEREKRRQEIRDQRQREADRELLEAIAKKLKLDVKKF